MGAISSEPPVGQVAIFGQVSTRTVQDYAFPLRSKISNRELTHCLELDVRFQIYSLFSIDF